MTTAIKFETEATILVEHNMTLATAFYKGEELTGTMKGGIVTAYSEKLQRDVSFQMDKVWISDRWELETCKVCGEDTEHGFIVGGEIHCSEKCLHKVVTPEEYEELFDNDEAYWTEWYGEEY